MAQMVDQLITIKVLVSRRTKDVSPQEDTKLTNVICGAVNHTILDEKNIALHRVDVSFTEDKTS